MLDYRPRRPGSVTVLSPKGTKSARTTAPPYRTNRRITFALHRSFVVAAIGRLPSALYRPIATPTNPGGRVVIRPKIPRLTSNYT